MPFVKTGVKNTINIVLVLRNRLPVGALLQRTTTRTQGRAPGFVLERLDQIKVEWLNGARTELPADPTPPWHLSPERTGR